MSSSTNGVFLEPGDPRWGAALERVAHDVYYTPEYLTVCASQNPGQRPRCYVWNFASPLESVGEFLVFEGIFRCTRGRFSTPVGNS
jgi:hypothetical protein